MWGLVCVECLARRSLGRSAIPPPQTKSKTPSSTNTPNKPPQNKHPPPQNTKKTKKNPNQNRRDKLRRVQGLDIADLSNYHHELLSTSSVRVGVFGNISQEAGVGALA